jgi:hypothetical protein
MYLRLIAQAKSIDILSLIISSANSNFWATIKAENLYLIGSKADFGEPKPDKA